MMGTIEPTELPELPINRLLLVVTGSAFASTMPQWLHWLQLSYPKLELRLVMTHSAERFVTRQALQARLHDGVTGDHWPHEEATARHVQWAEWAEAILVYPATVHFMARLALGLADSPALLAAHCTNAPVVVAPALPPGALDSEACQQHWQTLAARRNVLVVPPVLGHSLTTGRVGTWSPPPLPEVLRLLAEQYPTLTDNTAVESPRRDSPALVTEYGTGLLQTHITRIPATEGGGYLWQRRPGRWAPAPFRQLDPAVHERLATLSGAFSDTVGDGATGADAARLVVGHVDPPMRHYRVHGHESVAGRLLNGGPDAALVAPLRQLGSLLRRLHATPPPATVAHRSPGMARLGDWLSGRPNRFPAVAMLGALRRELGEERWHRLTGWYAEVLADTAEVTLAHGAPGLGSLVVSPDTSTAELLTGEDVCAQPWYLDLGWVVGELVELKWQIGGDPAGWQRLIDALFEGYGRDLGPNWHRVATLRVLLHAHDFGAYVQGPGDWLDRYIGFLRFLIDM